MHDGERFLVPSARDLLRQGEELRWQHRLGDAERVFAEALDVAKLTDGVVSDCTADAMVWLAIVQTLQSSEPQVLERALQLQQEALNIELSLHGEGSRRAIETRRTVAIATHRVGRRDEALEHIRICVDAIRKHGWNSGNARDAFVEMLELTFELGRTEESVSLSDELIAMELQASSSPRLVLRARFSRARGLLAIGRAVDAAEEFERVLNIAHSIGAPKLIDEMEDWLKKARDAVER